MNLIYVLLSAAVVAVSISEMLILRMVLTLQKQMDAFLISVESE